MDYKWLYEKLAPYYNHDVGRPGIDPVVLIKMVLIQHLFGIASLRKTYQEIQVNVAYRWFLGYGLLDQIPHFATVSYAFCKVNAERAALGKKPIEEDDDGDTPSGGATAEKTVSKTDPDCGMFVKGSHERQFAYEAHTACDRHGFVLRGRATRRTLKGSGCGSTPMIRQKKEQRLLLRKTAVL